MTAIIAMHNNECRFVIWIVLSELDKMRLYNDLYHRRQVRTINVNINFDLNVSVSGTCP